LPIIYLLWIQLSNIENSLAMANNFKKLNHEIPQGFQIALLQTLEKLIPGQEEEAEEEEE